MEPLANEEKVKKEQVAGLEAKKQELADEVSVMFHQRDDLKKEIALQLAALAAELEAKAHAADVHLAGAREDLKTLAQIGLSAADLSVLTHETKGIVSHHRHHLCLTPEKSHEGW